MKLTKELLINGPKQTGKRMHELVEKYYMDMGTWAGCSLMEIFDIIKKIPFKYDYQGEEWVQRPFFTMTGTGKGGDCDCKMICLASWAKIHGLPWRFVAVGTKKPNMHRIPLTHVLVEIKIDNRWIHCDPTYAFNILGQPFKSYDRRLMI